MPRPTLVPKEAGGQGDVSAFIAAFETLSFGNLSVMIKAGVHFGLFGGSILNLGTAWHPREYLPAIGLATTYALHFALDELRKSFAAARRELEALETAQAHVERLILERFLAAVEACKDRPLHDILARLAVLFAVSRLEQDRGWFLEHGYFEPAKTRALRKLVNGLCGELRPQAVPLVDGFGIPAEVLAAPIAQ